MQPVWVLSVDLQTKTATFQSGLSDAAKSARGAFTQIKQGSGEMGREVSENMTEARHGVMLLGEEFGIHLPRALAGFIASIGPIGAAMEAAFPFLAIAALATILIEHLSKMHEAGEKLTEDQGKFGVAVQNAFNLLDSKLIQAEIRSDELKNDHLGALRLQLEMIDHQSMEELVHSFDLVAKAADEVFKDLKTSWYQFGAGSEGAKHALDEFQNKYQLLLEQGKGDEAHGLLTGTLAQAQKILDFQKQYTANQSEGGKGGDYAKFEAAANGLKAMGVSISATTAGIRGETAAQQQLVDALEKQLGFERTVAEIKKTESANATRTTQGAMSGEASTRAKEAAESQQRIAQSGLMAAKAVAEAQLTIKRASIQERLAVDLDFNKREYEIQKAGNAAQIGALDKMAKDYPNALKALHDKALELEAGHAAQIAEITSKAGVAQAAKDLAALEQGEREKIDATQKGSAARLAVINQTIKAEEAAGLADTNYFRELLTQRVQLTEEMAEDAAKLSEQAGHEEAENIQKTGELSVQALKQSLALQESTRRLTDARRMADAVTVANAEYAVKVQALAREISALDTGGKEYQNKLKALQDKEKQLVQEHENEITAIQEKAEEERNARILSASGRFNDEIARGLTSVLMRHESFTKMITALGDQVVSGMLENAIKSMLMDDMTKEKDAAKAARDAFKIGMSIGGPAGFILGPVMGAAAFTQVMAFQGGTDRVPGVGTGDIVPARLEPGEGVVPGGVMDGLSKIAKRGGLDGGGQHIHIHAPIHMTAHALDADGVDEVFEKHADNIQKHFERTLRKLGR